MTDLTTSSPKGMNEAEGFGLAQVTFRVRCENIGHGESVFLLQADKRAKGSRIPLFTTVKSYPWYTTRTPLSLALPITKSPDISTASADRDACYRYRYAVYRAGIFHRWEDSSDRGDVEDYRHESVLEASCVHQVPLRFFHSGELYTVNDVLGATIGPPDIDHIKISQKFSSVSSLARKNSSNSSASLYGLNTSRPVSTTSMSETGGSKKKVGFAPQPTPSRCYDTSTVAKQAVHLTSSDGLIVVSAFLPVHLNRSDSGEWSADWDYEALLSMQTHLRVTRVGTVKWRGWHGNVGGGASSESGVPVDERHKVEAALRPFNCVPVWVPTNLFGEM